VSLEKIHTRLSARPELTPIVDDFLDRYEQVEKINAQRHPDTKPIGFLQQFAYRPFSVLHRTLSAEYMATDLDFVEWRKGKGVVGFIEVKEEGSLGWWQETVHRRVSGGLNAPLYFIRHNRELTKFDVYDIIDNKDDPLYWRVSQRKILDFIEGLGSR